MAQGGTLRRSLRRADRGAPSLGRGGGMPWTRSSASALMEDRRREMLALRKSKDADMRG